MALEAAVVIELAPSLAVMVFGVLPTAVGVALAAPVEIAAVAVPIVAAASIGSVGVPVVPEERQLDRRELSYRCECAARCITPQGSPML
jgi:hypothetical protein